MCEYSSTARPLVKESDTNDLAAIQLTPRPFLHNTHVQVPPLMRYLSRQRHPEPVGGVYITDLSRRRHSAHSATVSL